MNSVIARFFMKKFSRKIELELLDKARKILNDKASIDQINDWHNNKLSDRHKFEMMSNHFDAIGRLKSPDKNEKLKMTSEINKEIHAMLIAGALRCIQTSCEHVNKINIVKYVFLAPRICCCESCPPKFLDCFIKHDAEQPNADECDLCLKKGVKVFKKFQTVFNGCVFFGDACETCVSLI